MLCRAVTGRVGGREGEREERRERGCRVRKNCTVGL